MTNKLHDLPNIGKVIEKLLIEIGITTPEELYEVGCRDAFLRIRSIDPSACIRMLYGLEGAILGIKDSHLPKEIKQELLSFYNNL